MRFDLEKCVIEEIRSVREALEKVNQNQYGFIFSNNADGEITGLATDGDIRRGLINGITLDDQIKNCTKSDFLWASVDTPREQLIKQLDSNIKFIPILNDARKLQYIVSNDYLPLTDEKDLYIRARAPVRMSFGGGGSDLTHYFKANSGAVINAAISIYSHALMKTRRDSKIIIRSQDLAATLDADNLGDALLKNDKFGLIQSVLHVVQPQYGFELLLNSDFPTGSGLGGSATLAAVILGCFNKLRKDPWNQYEIAEIAFQAERLRLGIAGGWQDQYASVFGGFNFIEFYAKENIINPIRVHPDVVSELEECLVLCNTGIPHHSGDIHMDQKDNMSSTDVKKLVEANVKLTYKIRNYLYRGNLEKFGVCLDQAWQLKRKLSKKISNDHLDGIYNGARAHGALGGKLLGAGGGGFFVFYVPPFEKFKLLDFLKSQNLKVQNFQFEAEGLRVWSSRGKLENRNVAV